ncbi:DUF3969 family protein [Gilliamella sp. Pas-s95]|nr:DUF3969 family protein [Gilliamella sp. Pas-s95]MWN05658.1 hypothetical protein [Gilliamella sp. Pas-s95]
MGGCELEDYESLLPEQLESRIDDLIISLVNMIKNQPKFSRMIDKDINVK